MTVDPASEKEVDFSASDKIPVIYKLTRTAEDGKTVTREYKVAATICKHDWKEATCTEAAICKLCGVTGEAALGHDWKESNLYKKPAVSQTLWASKDQSSSWGMTGQKQPAK